MLELTVTLADRFDEETNSFDTETTVLRLEHSLLSLSKWESNFERPFLKEDNLSPEDMFYYIKCMAVDDNVPDHVFECLDATNLKAINEYIGSKRSATWFWDEDQKDSKDVITSELVYYWMFSYNIPLSCESWFLNRLFTLIKVFGVKNQKPKKRSTAEIAARNRKLNEERRAKLNTKG